jgi:mRNA deadenylase 3'-5' endonuclease subunit Ccr4
VIEQSVSGTIDRRNFEERMRDTEETGDAVKSSKNDEEAPRDLTISKILLSMHVFLEAYRHKEPFKEPMSAATSIYFVLAGRCLNIYSSTPC